MKRREAGQAIILVLILMAVGVTMVVPMLQFSFTTSRGGEIVTRNLKNLYAAEGGQEYVMWKLLYDNYAQNFTEDGQRDDLQVDVCGTPVNITVIMRAVPSWQGVVLATDDAILPTKSVSPTTNNGTAQTYTYTIRLEQISDDTSEGLDAVYDILPPAFNKTADYVPNSSTLRVDGGTPQPIADPLEEVVGGQLRLCWPSTYNYITKAGGFSSPVRDFVPGQVKEISFQVTAPANSILNNSINYNWVVLKPWNTLSGPQAPITRGAGTTPKNAMLNIWKTSDLTFVMPGQATPVRYTIGIQNQQGSTDRIMQIHDYLPSGFSYSMGSTAGITTNDPDVSYENINGVDRWHLSWTTSPFPKSISAFPTTLYLSFTAIATQSSTGSYYNELMVIPDNPIPSPFSTIGVTYADFNSSYSWNTSPVIVPAYDSETEAGDTTIDARLGIELGGGTSAAWISSWQVR